MQFHRPYSKSAADQECAHKKWLLGIIAVIMVPTFIILVTPYVLRTSTIFPFLLHLASVTIASYLTTISFASYRNSGDSRVLFTAISFIALVVVELLLLLNTVNLVGDLAIPVVDIEVSHLLLFIMLALFAVGVLKTNH